ncbi:MAG: hypothetical protein JJ916_10625 [Phycisphaerales bacterium]|nr:hypothetical protein [Phycisphaerales bacterium]
MDNIKPWQIILIAVAVVVLGFSLWRSFTSGQVNLPDSVLVIDVETGDMYRMGLGKRNGAYFPEKNPESGQHNLMPVVKTESGDWIVPNHARPAMQDIDGENKFVNESDWRVNIESEDIKGTLKAGG